MHHLMPNLSTPSVYPIAWVIGLILLVSLSRMAIRVHREAKVEAAKKSKRSGIRVPRREET